MADLYKAQADPRQQQKHFPFGLDDGGLVDGFALNQHDWLEAIRHRRPPETDGREGLRDLAAAFAILESAAVGRTVEVAQVLSGELRRYQRPIDERFGLA